MAEWSNAPDSKSGSRVSRDEGSNPSLSATHERPRPPALRVKPLVLALGVLLGACASRSGDVRPLAVSAADFASWNCGRVFDEIDRLQRRAAEVAYTVDERAGNNIVALGIGLIVFWPALLAMQSEGPEARELAALKGRDDALRRAADDKACAPPAAEMAGSAAAALPVAIGDRLVYEERASPRQPSRELVVRVAALRRDEIDFALLMPPQGGAPAAAPRWSQDLAGNVSGPAPAGFVHWRRLLRPELALGQVLAGELVFGDDATVRARVRGQVVAIGPQTLAGRHFDVAVIELFGDVLRGPTATRLDGVLAVDRSSGVVMRLDLRSSDPEFSLRRQLARVEPAS